MAITSSNSMVFTQDLRAAAQDYRRDSNNKHKWELGETFGPGTPTTHPRPKRAPPKQKVYSAHSKNIVIHHDELAVDSSCDEEVMAPDTAPAPDAEVAYSYDAARGPSHGSQVLAGAVDKALVKFENTVTEKLVKDEYEVLGANGDAVATKTGKKAARGTAASSPTDEDEYEFV